MSQKPHVRDQTRPDKRMKVLRNRDIKILREQYLKEQENVDPITLLTIKNPALDHDHKSSFVRGVLDRDSNQVLGKIESSIKRFLGYSKIPIPELLRRFADYIENNKSTEQIVHPKSLSQIISRFSRMKVDDQDLILIEAGLVTTGTKQEKTKRYRKYLMRDENILKF